MKNPTARYICILAVFAASPAIALDTLNSREHTCAALQEQAILDGQVTLKTLFSTLTVHNPLKNCHNSQHQVVSPVWKTSDERFCIVGSYCSPAYSSDDL